MNNNYFRKIQTVNEQFINIPIELTFDMEGREDLINEWENNVIEEVINPINDFEITKFAHKDYTSFITSTTQFLFTNPFTGQQNLITYPTSVTAVEKTEINYEFYFFDYLTDAVSATSVNWLTDYENASFTDSEIYYFSNSFKNSFFKLDFYDSNVTENQTILLSVIIPTQQGVKEPGTIGPPLNQTQVEVKKPKFVLDYTGADKEGFFIYWLKDKGFIDRNEFYVSAKFFNAKKGQFVRMMNEPQSNFPGNNRFNIDKTEFFYYKYVLNYQTNQYEVYTYDNGVGNIQRVGTTTPIKWYEFVNP